MRVGVIIGVGSANVIALFDVRRGKIKDFKMENRRKKIS